MSKRDQVYRNEALLKMEQRITYEGPCCPRCGGGLFGDGRTVVLHCEHADEEEVSYTSPDDNPVYCSYTPEDFD